MEIALLLVLHLLVVGRMVLCPRYSEEMSKDCEDYAIETPSHLACHRSTSQLAQHKSL